MDPHILFRSGTLTPPKRSPKRFTRRETSLSPTPAPSSAQSEPLDEAGVNKFLQLAFERGLLKDPANIKIPQLQAIQKGSPAQSRNDAKTTNRENGAKTTNRENDAKATVAGETKYSILDTVRKRAKSKEKG